jgi:hypothetical protein
MGVPRQPIKSLSMSASEHQDGEADELPNRMVPSSMRHPTGYMPVGNIAKLKCFV